jgi:hypothetical protein
MSRCRRSGIAMLLVIMLIGMFGVTLAYLGHSCRLMIAQTDRRLQKAVDRNLVLSGLAWAKRQGSELRTQNSARAAQNAATLDVNELGGQGARLSVTVEDSNGSTATVHVTTFVPSTRYDLSRSRTFQLKGPSRSMGSFPAGPTR